MYSHNAEMPTEKIVSTIAVWYEFSYQILESIIRTAVRKIVFTHARFKR